MNWIQNLSSTKPYMVVPGNHETECHSPACTNPMDLALGHSLRNFSAYNVRWAMPYKESYSRTNMWYSFDFGTAHFVSANTETDFPGAKSGSLYKRQTVKVSARRRYLVPSNSKREQTR